MSFFKKLKKSMGIEGEEKLEEKKEEKKEKEKKVKKEGKEGMGQLAVDVYETEKNFVIQSTISGVKAEDLNISIENDIVTIKGVRQKPEEPSEKKYLYQECYWGPFSRQIILPEEVDSSQTQAITKDGVLTLTLPKILRKEKRKIIVKQVD